MKLIKSERLFFGCKIDSKLREALAQAKPGDRKYFEDPKSEFLRVVAVDEERWIGKIIAGGIQVTDVDDIQRNVISILKRISPALRLTASAIKIFAIDETVYSRELAPLAGFYPSVYLGAPWWFLDAPDAIARHRAAVTETAGFYRSSGFIDDTRAFLSIPARHDTARHVDAGFLARLVVEGRVRMDAAERIIDDLVDAIPREVFKL